MLLLYHCFYGKQNHCSPWPNCHILQITGNADTLTIEGDSLQRPLPLVPRHWAGCFPQGPPHPPWRSGRWCWLVEKTCPQSWVPTTLACPSPGWSHGYGCCRHHTCPTPQTRLRWESWLSWGNEWLKMSMQLGDSANRQIGQERNNLPPHPTHSSHHPHVWFSQQTGGPRDMNNPPPPMEMLRRMNPIFSLYKYPVNVA